MIGCLQTRVRKQPIIAFYFSLRMYSSFITSRPEQAPQNVGSGLIWIQTDTMIVFLKEFKKKIDFEILADDKKIMKITQQAKCINCSMFISAL